jgi:hypothetical protein
MHMAGVRSCYIQLAGVRSCYMQVVGVMSCYIADRRCQELLHAGGRSHEMLQQVVGVMNGYIAGGRCQELLHCRGAGVRSWYMQIAGVRSCFMHWLESGAATCRR